MQPSDASLAAPALKPPAAPGRDLYCYFDNDIKVRAPFDAARLAQRLGAPTKADSAERFDPISKPGRRRPEGEHTPGPDPHVWLAREPRTGNAAT